MDKVNKHEREVCLELLARPDVFDTNIHRVIEGIATTGIRNKHGYILDPHGAEFTMPVPLLLSHNWLRPIGRVTKASRSPAGLKFTAQIANAKLAWVADVWDDIKTGAFPAVSLDATNARPLASDLFFWHWEELSVCEAGANPDALIWTVKEVYRPGVIWVDGKKHETIYRDVRPESVTTQ